MTAKKNEKQATSLQLSKNSPPEVITNYFKKIFELKQGGKEFPVNLNDAWPLAYSRKQEAVKALRANFVEDIHFQALRQNAQRGAASPIDYFLSVACLEYFIASKVHPVFEVYRKVFHAAVEQKQLSASAQRIKQLESRYVKHPEFEATTEIIESAMMACGSANQLALRIGISAAVLSHIKSRPWLVSSENMHGIELACRNILSRDARLDTETVEQLMMIDNQDLRMNLFSKMKKGGLI